jgi:regulator of replication initiation timing
MNITDEQIMDVSREMCVDFRWPSTAIDIGRAILAMRNPEVDELKSQIGWLQMRVENLRVLAGEQMCKMLEAQVKDLRAEIADLKSTIDEQMGDITRLTQERADLRKGTERLAWIIAHPVMYEDLVEETYYRNLNNEDAALLVTREAIDAAIAKEQQNVAV